MALYRRRARMARRRRSQPVLLAAVGEPGIYYSMSIVSTPVEASRPVTGHLIMMIPMTPPRHSSSISPREHVARATAAGNKELGMGDLCITELSGAMRDRRLF